MQTESISNPLRTTNFPLKEKFVSIRFEIFLMTSPLKFLRETRDELTQVSFPPQKEVIRLTAVILLVSLIVGLYVGGIDFLLTKVAEFALK